MKPRVKLTDPAFKYTPSYMTSVAKTFQRIRRELAAQKPTVVPISKRASK